MNEAIEKCKYCGRELYSLELYELCPCQIGADVSEWMPTETIEGDD